MISADQEFHRFTISEADFVAAEAYIAEARRHDDTSVAYEALLFAALVAYYRPFSPNEKKGAVSATASLSVSSLLSLTASEQALHDVCKVLRNKALAHSEFSFNPTSINTSRDVVWSKPFSLLAQQLDLEPFATLVAKVHRACTLSRAEYILAPRRKRAPVP